MGKNVQKVPCLKCGTLTERLATLAAIQKRRCPNCEYEGWGRWSFEWDETNQVLSRALEHKAYQEHREMLDRLQQKKLDEEAKLVYADQQFSKYWKLHLDSVERGWSELLEPPFGLVKEAIKKGLLSREEYERHQKYLADQEIVGDPEKNPPEDTSGG